MGKPPDAQLVIGVARTTAERVQLARLLGDAEALLLVSSAEQAREFLELTGQAGTAPVVLTPTTLQLAEAGPEYLPIAAGQLVSVRPVAHTSRPTVVSVPRPAPDEPEPEPEPELVLDVDRRVARWRDREVPLTRLEHDFLRCLVTEPGRVWTYQRLHHAVWGNEHLGHGSHIHSVVKRLRQKLTQLGATVTIHAVRGVGFHLLPAT